MKKVFILLGLCLTTNIISAQVGINKETPDATLDINAKTDGTSPEGVLIPRLEGDQIKNMPVQNQQESMVVYAKSAATNLDNASPEAVRAKKITEKGFYYWDGSVWQKLKGNDWSLTGNRGTDPDVNFLGTIDDKPLKIRVNNNHAGYLSTKSLAIGYGSMPYQEGDITNLAIGSGSLSNVGVGASATNDSKENLAVGTNALNQNTTGSDNLAIGHIALSSSKTANSNVAIGSYTLSSLTTGDYNIAIGSAHRAQTTYAALANLLNGNGNISMGTYNSASMKGGYYNVSIGVLGLKQLRLGENNTVLGGKAGEILKKGNNNIFIGYDALSPFGIEDESFQLNIGNWIFGKDGKIGIGESYKGKNHRNSISPFVPGRIPTEQLEVDGSIKLLKINENSYNSTEVTDKVVVADADGVLKTVERSAIQGSSDNIYTTNGTIPAGTTRTVTFSDDNSNITLKRGTANNNPLLIANGSIKATAFNLNSDARLKTNVTDLSSDKIDNLRAVSYVWNAEGKKFGGDDKLQYGFIAQEVEKVYPNLVSTDKDGYKSVNYTQVIPVLTKALQEERAETKQLKETLESQNKRIEELEKAVQALLKK